MAKPSLAFVDHELHQKTRSAEFLRELFRETFDVHDYWDESWRGGPSVPPAEINKHDYVFYLQVISSFAELKEITIPILWAPMYDGFKPTYPYWKMISYFNIKILSFSKRMADHFATFDIPTMYVQYYYLKPEKAEGPAGNHVFFWYRGGVEFEELRRIINPSQIDSFTFLEAPDKDGNTTKISTEDRERYKINHVTGFLPRDRFLELVRNASIYIAPRKKEGIGAFTEPLALGKVVIAYNEGVQDEYITSGVDGFLFDEKSGPIDLIRTNEISEAAFTRAQKGYAQWLRDREQITPFLRAPYTASTRIIPLWFWSLCYEYFKLVPSLRYYVRTRLLRPKHS